jgi:hypothetical protein
MDPTLVTIALTIVGLVSGRLLIGRFPRVSYTQMYCATVACLGGVLIAARPDGSQFWHYMGLTIAVMMGTFLIMVFLRRLDTPPPTGSV